MLKFYRWLRKFAQDQAKNHVNLDLKCPNCNTWSSSIQGKKITDTDTGYLFECGQCEAITGWRTDIFPVPVLYDDYPETHPQERDE